jgi:23S rRNA (guanine745-N1)-methyltransferase
MWMSRRRVADVADDVRLSDVLACPHCGLALSLTATAASCANGHAFDRARDGHFHLLVGGRLRSDAIPGDTPDALAARRRFLSTGGYGPIAAALAAAVGEVDGPVLDVGCGEGYYTSHLPASARFGLDVSKRAVQMAARLLPDSTFVVGSAYRLPVLDASLAAATSVFAPHPLDELSRVLRPGGRWVTVTPGPMHLVEMRPRADGTAGSKALDRQRRRAERPDGSTSAQRLEFRLELDAASADDLFLMTPIRWQASARPPVDAVSVDVWVATGGHQPR